ncbi:hypothetical protein ASF49_15615 [Methylobacterium sp. Leaf104]|jgi:hypothetical protein|uniref:hypothetical protein n=1 Tax=Methylobacterium TaxID=407 RepID=UPI0006FCC443|nr:MULTISPECIES: hypothetical protein [Methylobacterium]KQO42456.1 hypothetical protein ASF08_12665 [Methylobacterium sp. Leaf85]KQP29586.1 hypothetical protein ASF49_15615 [Methylobacterium sp. Leaf104]KQQ24215.1 hypothetical protein ASF58_16680 [Methylobacterium sp. Leaf125]MCI9881870.1 hypothetical protein [Methylobacterium goesingense]
MPEDAYDAADARHLEGMPLPRARPAGHVEDRYPVEDGPGSGERVELVVRVLRGTARSTVIVADPATGRALAQDVVPHGGEAGAAAAAVYAALKKANACL